VNDEEYFTNRPNGKSIEAPTTEELEVHKEERTALEYVPEIIPSPLPLQAQCSQFTRALEANIATVVKRFPN